MRVKWGPQVQLGGAPLPPLENSRQMAGLSVLWCHLPVSHNQEEPQGRGRILCWLRVTLWYGSRRQRAYVLLGPGFTTPLGNWAVFHHLPATPCTICQPANLAFCLWMAQWGESGSPCNWSSSPWFCKDTTRAGVAAGSCGEVRNCSHYHLAPLKQF